MLRQSEAMYYFHHTPYTDAIIHALFGLRGEHYTLATQLHNYDPRPRYTSTEH